MLFRFQHFHLLLIESVDSQEPLFLDAVQTFKGIFEDVRFNVAEIAVYAAELIPEFLADLLGGFPAALVKLEKPASGYFPVCPGFLFFPI